MGAHERLDKDRSYEDSVDNVNVGNQEILDMDYYENSHDKDSAVGGGGGGGEGRP